MTDRLRPRAIPSLARGPRAPALLPGPFIAMIHLRALPGSPFSKLSVAEIARKAADEAHILASEGADAVIVENMHDAPYMHGRQMPQITTAMTAATMAVQGALAKHRTARRRIPVGIQVLSGGNHEALAIAVATGGSFIRCENFVFAHVGDEGLMAVAEAGPLLRYRREIGGEHVAIFCDVKKKHASHAITSDLTIAETAEAAIFFGADGLIVTGTATGKPIDPKDLDQVRLVTGKLVGKPPVFVGSGVTPATAASLLALADGLIAGSCLKRGGHWANELDPARVRRLAESVCKGRKRTT